MPTAVPTRFVRHLAQAKQWLGEGKQAMSRSKSRK